MYLSYRIATEHFLSRTATVLLFVRVKSLIFFRYKERVCANHISISYIARCITPLCIQTHLQLHQQRESKSQLVSVDECLNNAHESLQSLLNPLPT